MKIVKYKCNVCEMIYPAHRMFGLDFSEGQEKVHIVARDNSETHVCVHCLVGLDKLLSENSEAIREALKNGD